MKKLYDILCEKYGSENVGTENSIGTKRIDVVVKTNDGYNLYEIKTNKTPRGCVREAMGQILDYAYFECKDKINKMVIVGHTPANDDVEDYLSSIRTKNSLDIYYLSVSMN